MSCRSSERAPVVTAPQTRRCTSLAVGLCGGLVGALTAGCSLITDPFATNESSGDPYPIPVDLSSGAVHLFTNEPGGISRDSVVDVLSPVSLMDRGQDQPARAQQRSLYVVGATTAVDRGNARALLQGQVLEIHPCADPVCEVGDGDRPKIAFQVVLGADLFAGDALRLDLSQRRLSLYPDIAGSSSQRTELCEAVFPEPFRGGGTLVLGGTEVPYVGRRITVSACAAFKANAPLAEQGADLLLLVSTAIGPTLLSESAYERYRVIRGAQSGATVPALDSLPLDSVTIPSGRVVGRRAQLSTLTMVGESTDRGACGDVCSHKRFRATSCVPGAPATARCNPTDDTRLGAPALVEFTEAVDVLVISDEAPLLVGLRAELHPDTAVVDGIIGTRLLSLLRLDIDYPNNRLLARCAASAMAGAAARCVTWPDLPNLDAATCARAEVCTPLPAAPPAR